MKIDVFTHVQPERYGKAIYRHSDKFLTDKNVQDRRPTLTDHSLRMKIIEKYDGYVQVLSATHPPLEEVFNPVEAAELARMCNDEIAELLAKYPRKYIAAIANLPLNNVDETLKETERAIKKLGFKGVVAIAQRKQQEGQRWSPRLQWLSKAVPGTVGIHPSGYQSIWNYPHRSASNLASNLFQVLLSRLFPSEFPSPFLFILFNRVGHQNIPIPFLRDVHFHSRHDA